jgi:hypothetical protein
MNTHDPDRCPAATEVIRVEERVVVQCQDTLYHSGQHTFHEDHYTVLWTDAEAGVLG